MCILYIYIYICIYIWGRQNHTASWARSCGARCVGVRVCVVCEARMLLLAGPALWCQRGEGPPVGMVKRAENGIDYTSTKNQVSDPSIHPSIHPPSTQTGKHVCPSSTVSRKQSRQANQQTNAPKSNILLPVHDASITVCIFSKPKQPTSQAGRTNQHINQNKWGKKERVATKL